MKTMLIILSVLGCDDAVKTCDVLEAPARTYQSQAECQVASLKIVEESRDQPYPTVVAQCGTAEETLALVESVAPERQYEIVVAALEPRR